MRVVQVGILPGRAVGAAGEFHARIVPEVLGMGESLVLLFYPAPHDHRGWRLAAVQDLARAAAPQRVNGIVGEDEAAIAEALAYLEAALGVTGQLLAVDGKSGETR